MPEMSQSEERVRTFDVEGQEVTCYEFAGDRLWRCGCAAFQRTLTQHSEGFCPHTAVAIMRFLQEELLEG
jgi:hypothetical protein